MDSFPCFHQGWLNSMNWTFVNQAKYTSSKEGITSYILTCLIHSLLVNVTFFYFFFLFSSFLSMNQSILAVLISILKKVFVSLSLSLSLEFSHTFDFNSWFDNRDYFLLQQLPPSRFGNQYFKSLSFCS